MCILSFCVWFESCTDEYKTESNSGTYTLWAQIGPWYNGSKHNISHNICCVKGEGTVDHSTVTRRRWEGGIFHRGWCQCILCLTKRVTSFWIASLSVPHFYKFDLWLQNRQNKWRWNHSKCWWYNYNCHVNFFFLFLSIYN